MTAPEWRADGNAAVGIGPVVGGVPASAPGTRSPGPGISPDGSSFPPVGPGVTGIGARHAVGASGEGVSALMGQAAELALLAKGLVSGCVGFLDPVVLAQLDAALACELADRSLARAAEAALLVEAAMRETRPAASLEQLIRHASGAKAAATKAAAFAAKAAGVVSALGGGAGPEVGADLVEAVDGAALVDLIAGLEAAKNALTGVQAKAQAVFAAQQRLAQARAGVPKDKLGMGIGQQIGLARGESAHRGRQLTELSSVLVREMPHTLNAMVSGVVGEYRGQIMATETVFLSAEHRAEVDRALASDPEKLATMGTRELAAAARNAAYQLEPEVFTKRREKAVGDRHVTLRPAADGMTLLSALIPLRHGVAILNTLTKVADAAKSGADPRGKGQLMADALIHRLLEHAPCDLGAGGMGDHLGAPPAEPASGAGTADRNRRAGEDGLCTTIVEPGIMIELVMTDRALFEGANDPAVLVGHEPIPAPEARAMILGSAEGTGGCTPPKAWLRRLYTHPETGALLSMDSQARFFPEGMKEFLRLQYQRCATPNCDAPIREYDHIKSWASGGSTTICNGQGLCTSCNQAKEAPGWSERAVKDGTGPPITVVTTPTGHQYTGTAPLLQEGPPGAE
jgi:hypothetical protein